MKDQPKIYGPETPNYALLNASAKGLSAAEVRASKKLTGNKHKKPRSKRLDANHPS